jgi:hypothetical protein
MPSHYLLRETVVLIDEEKIKCCTMYIRKAPVDALSSVHGGHATGEAFAAPHMPLKSQTLLLQYYLYIHTVLWYSYQRPGFSTWFPPLPLRRGLRYWAFRPPDAPKKSFRGLQLTLLGPPLPFAVRGECARVGRAVSARLFQA